MVHKKHRKVKKIVDNPFQPRYYVIVDAVNIIAGMAQEVERRIGNAEVTGPTPVSSFAFLRGKTLTKPQFTGF